MLDARHKQNWGYGARPVEVDAVGRPVADPEELAGTADAGDHEEGLAATAEPDGDHEEGSAAQLSRLANHLPSDDDSDGGFFWAGSSDKWASIFSAALGLASPLPICVESKRPTVATFFSGTDAPILALEMLAAGVFKHTVSCDSSPASRAFIGANFKPEHLFNNVEDSSLPLASCGICGGSCGAFHDKINFLMAGFPCTPFSGMSPRRWKDGYDPLAHPDAAAFLSLRRFLGNADHESEPDAVLLENVGSVQHQSRSQGPTAAELIMSGIKKKTSGKRTSNMA